MLLQNKKLKIQKTLGTEDKVSQVLEQDSINELKLYQLPGCRGSAQNHPQLADQGFF